MLSATDPMVNEMLDLRHGSETVAGKTVVIDMLFFLLNELSSMDWLEMAGGKICSHVSLSPYHLISYPFIHPSNHLSIYISTYLSIIIYQSIYLYLSSFLSISQSIHLSICLSAHLCAYRIPFLTHSLLICLHLPKL